MDAVQYLVLVGFSHRTAPIGIRERYAVRPDDHGACLQALIASPGVDEAYVLSTCNRTEVLLLATEADEATALARQHVFRNIPDEHLYSFHGVHAVIHLFRVAAGLDSLVLGESEVLGQVKHAFEAAQSVSAVSTMLVPLITQSLSVGKRVRTETELGRGTLSVARVGVDVAKQVFGSLDGVHTLILGAGETARLVAHHLASERAPGIAFVNRTLERAESAAHEFDGVAHGLEDLPEVLAQADLVVTCVDGDGAILGPDLFTPRQLNKRARPMLVIDLSVPRAVDPLVVDLDNLLVYDLDDLEPVVEGNRQSRSAAMARADEILVSEVHKFLALRTYAAFSPAIGELSRRFEEAREDVIDTIAGDNASPREMELAHLLARRLLDLSLATMKEGARHARSETILDREYQRFLNNLENAP